MATFLRRRFWLAIGLCAALAALLLVAMPAEKTIGQVIKIVYLHGALSRAAMAGFVAGGVVGLLFWLRPRPALVPWSNALTLSGWAFWVAHFLVSIPATRLTWGPWIAWGEPRVTMTLQVAGAGLAVLAINWLLGSARFATAANTLLGGTVLFLAGETGVLRHPLDPIGSSPSPLLRVVYLVLLVPVIVSMLLVAWRLTGVDLVQCNRAGHETETDRAEA